MKIDAHQHFWKIERGDYGWITPDVRVLYRDFLPEDLEPHLERNGISQTIVVQAAPTLDETRFILGLSEQCDRIAGVVGWLDLESPNYVHHFGDFLRHPKFVGIRVMIQDMEDETIILQPKWIEAFSYFADIDFPVDLLVKSYQLSTVIKLLDRVPSLRGVIDHIAKPDIANAVLEPWITQIEQIAKYTNIYCKVSGMVTEAIDGGWKPDDFTSYVHHVVKVFGANRVMYGSDWPVCLLAASYDEVYRIAEGALPSNLTPQEMDQIFGRTAAQFYRLNVQPGSER